MLMLPDDLSTILALCIKGARDDRDFWRDVMKDKKRADKRNHRVWALMDVRDALKGSGGYFPAPR